VRRELHGAPADRQARAAVEDEDQLVESVPVGLDPTLGSECAGSEPGVHGTGGAVDVDRPPQTLASALEVGRFPVAVFRDVVDEVHARMLSEPAARRCPVRASRTPAAAPFEI
jgi:hypothetical protein